MPPATEQLTARATTTEPIVASRARESQVLKPAGLEPTLHTREDITTETVAHHN